MSKLISFIAVVFSLSLLPLLASADGDYSVGYRRIQVTSEETSEAFPMAVVYPTRIPSKLVRFGPFEMDLSIGSKIADGKFPLVVISHGSGGTNLGHRSIAFALVERGFVVGMPLHPKNNYKNNEAEGTLENLQNRPKHIKSAIDALLVNSDISKNIDSEKIAVIGHSAGGYTALAVSGGIADTRHIIDLCTSKPDISEAFCGLVKNDKIKSVKLDIQRDERVKAIVLMAPLGVVFQSKDSLAQVDIPTLLLSAEKDDELTEPHHSEVIASNFLDKDKLTYETIENAGHYSFITPFPEAARAELGVVAEDPEGFDRAQFHATLSKQIADYLGGLAK